MGLFSYSIIGKFNYEDLVPNEKSMSTKNSSDSKASLIISVTALFISLVVAILTYIQSDKFKKKDLAIEAVKILKDDKFIRAQSNLEFLSKIKYALSVHEEVDSINMSRILNDFYGKNSDKLNSLLLYTDLLYVVRSLNNVGTLYLSDYADNDLIYNHMSILVMNSKADIDTLSKYLITKQYVVPADEFMKLYQKFEDRQAYNLSND